MGNLEADQRATLGQIVERLRLEIIVRHKAAFDLAYDVSTFCQQSKIPFAQFTRQIART